MALATTIGQTLRRLLAEIGGDHIDGQLLPARRSPQLPAQLGTVHHRHLQVGQHQIHRFRLQDVQRQTAIGGAQYPGSQLTQLHADQHPVHLVIFHQEDTHTGSRQIRDFPAPLNQPGL
ncbi:hypothetical protein D3C76_892630 [compost metagenome]